MTMQSKPMIKGHAQRLSLIERAAAAYDFDSKIREQIVPPPLGDKARAIAAVAVEMAWPNASPAAAPIPTVITPARPRQSRRAAIDRAELIEGGYALPEAGPTALAEEFRIVKRQLLLSALGGQGVEPLPRARAILVCSAEPDEGKTFCAVNLALSLAQEKDIEVLLVDADFAKPEILSTLGLEGGPGLMDALADRHADVEDFVIATDLDGLSVLPSGRAMNEANELLASERTKDIFEKLLLNPSRIIIFDSSPALATSSSSVLANLVGQTMLVVRADVTGETELNEALSLLTGCPQIRLLLNAAQLAPRGRRFGAYYGYGG